MIKYQYSNPPYCEPPGCFLEFVNGGNTEVGIVQEHRFALFYWNQWHNNTKHKQIPALFSIDYHHDLCPPSNESELRDLDTSSDEEVAKFCWARINVVNDTHPKSAMYLNIISNVHILCRQHYDGELLLTDKDGQQHSIYLYSDLNKFKSAMETYDKIILDIDLDYFIMNYGSEKVKKVAPNKNIRSTVEIIRDQWPKIRGITIAREPFHCDGILNSNKILSEILKCLK